MFHYGFRCNESQTVHSAQAYNLAVVHIGGKDDKMAVGQTKTFLQLNIFLNIAAEFPRFAFDNNRHPAGWKEDHIQFVQIFVSETDFHIARTRKPICLPALLCLCKQFAQGKPFQPAAPEEVSDGSGAL